MAVSAEDLMKWQEDLSNSSHQREVADLQAAGLNPVLSAGSLSGASTPSGTTSGSSSGSGSGSASSNSGESKPGADTPLGSAIYSLNPNGSTLGIPNWLIQSGYQVLYDATGGDISIDGLATAVFGTNVSGVNLWNTLTGNSTIDNDSGNRINDTGNSASELGGSKYFYANDKYHYTSEDALKDTDWDSYWNQSSAKGNYNNAGNTKWRLVGTNKYHPGRYGYEREKDDVDAIAGVQNNEYHDAGETWLSKLWKKFK